MFRIAVARHWLMVRWQTDKLEHLLSSEQNLVRPRRFHPGAGHF